MLRYYVTVCYNAIKDGIEGGEIRFSSVSKAVQFRVLYIVVWRYSNPDDVQNYRASTRFLNFELSLYNNRVPVERPSYLLHAYVYQSQCKLDSEWEGGALDRSKFQYAVSVIRPSCYE